MKRRGRRKNANEDGNNDSSKQSTIKNVKAHYNKGGEDDGGKDLHLGEL